MPFVTLTTGGAQQPESVNEVEREKQVERWRAREREGEREVFGERERERERNVVNVIRSYRCR